MNDIKSLIDDIINTTDNSYPDKGNYDADTKPVKFDKNVFKEKLSMGVLKDVVNAMMQDDTQNVDGIIDDSISRHLNDNYGGSSYNYLVSARDNLDSRMVSDIIQEIDDKTDEVAEEISEKKDSDIITKDTDVRDIVKHVDNYDDFREKIKKKVSESVVEDVKKVITTKNDAPVFDDLDEKLKKNKDGDTTTESVIINICGQIVSESALLGNNMSIEEGIERASVEYCIHEMDKLFKNHSRINLFNRHKQ